MPDSASNCAKISARSLWVCSNALIASKLLRSFISFFNSNSTLSLLYFYPKDDTPGCTLEGHDFTRLKNQFSELNTVVFGISRDSVKSHQKFIEKCGFKIDLLADTDEKLCQMFDVIKEKNMYGKTVLGIERSTFIINEKQELMAEFRKVKADGHAEEILNFIRSKN